MKQILYYKQTIPYILELDDDDEYVQERRATKEDLELNKNPIGGVPSCIGVLDEDVEFKDPVLLKIRNAALKGFKKILKSEDPVAIYRSLHASVTRAEIHMRLTAERPSEKDLASARMRHGFRPPVSIGQETIQPAVRRYQEAVFHDGECTEDLLGCKELRHAYKTELENLPSNCKACDKQAVRKKFEKLIAKRIE